MSQDAPHHLILAGSGIEEQFAGGMPKEMNIDLKASVPENRLRNLFCQRI
jgi:hypothetical protein